MALFLRNLFFGVLSMVLTACGVGAQIRAGVETEPQLRAPLTPLTILSGPQSTLDEELRLMSGQAGVIFAGQVVAIRTSSAMGSSAGWVEVEFRVAQAIRGCADQGTYVLREWAGLWAGGFERYQVGERLLMLLHTPAASGLSSPVGGQDGAIPITGGGAAPGPEDGFVGLGEQAVDLRWVEARLLRTVSENRRLHARPIAPLEPVYVGKQQMPVVTRKAMLPRVQTNQRFEEERLGGPERVQIPAGSIGSTESKSFEGAVNGPETARNAQESPLSSVLAMLGVWEAQQVHAAR